MEKTITRCSIEVILSKKLSETSDFLKDGLVEQSSRAAEVLSKVSCPICGASIGLICINKDGRPCAPHAERLKKAASNGPHNNLLTPNKFYRKRLARFAESSVIKIKVNLDENESLTLNERDRRWLAQNDRPKSRPTKT